MRILKSEDGREFVDFQSNPVRPKVSLEIGKATYEGLKNSQFRARFSLGSGSRVNSAFNRLERVTSFPVTIKLNFRDQSKAGYGRNPVVVYVVLTEKPTELDEGRSVGFSIGGVSKEEDFQ